MFINGNHIGGYDDTVKSHKQGTLAKLLNADEIVINSLIIKPRTDESIESFFSDLIKNHKIVIFSKTTCPFCAKVKELFNSLNESYASLDLDEIGN